MQYIYSHHLPSITTFPRWFSACTWRPWRNRNSLPAKVINSHFTSFIHSFKHVKVSLRCSGFILDYYKLFAYVRLKSESLQLTLVNLIFISQKLTHHLIHALYKVFQVFEENAIFLGHSYLLCKHLQFLNPLLMWHSFMSSPPFHFVYTLLKTISLKLLHYMWSDQ